jgi:hypothetical protein
MSILSFLDILFIFNINLGIRTQAVNIFKGKSYITFI